MNKFGLFNKLNSGAILYNRYLHPKYVINKDKIVLLRLYIWVQGISIKPFKPIRYNLKSLFFIFKYQGVSF